MLIDAIKKLFLLLLLASVFEHGKLFAQPAITKFSNTFEKQVSQLGVNPNLVIEDLSKQVQSTADPIELAQLHLVLSLAYNKQVHPQEALNHAGSGLKLISVDFQPWLFHYLNISKGVAHDLLGEPGLSIELASLALEWSETHQHQSLLIKSLVARSLAYNTLRSPVDALRDAQRAYSLAPQKDPLIARSQIAGNIALVYEYRRQLERAIPYFEEAVNFHRKHQRWRDLGDVLYGLGQANLNTGNTKVGKAQLEESIDVARRVNDIQGIAYGLKQLAGIEYKDNQLEKSESMFREALSIFELSGNAFTRSDCLMWLARIALKKQLPQQAFNYLSKAEKLIKIESMPDHYYRLQEQKSEVYEAIGDFEKAFNLLKENHPKRLAMLRKQYVNQFEELKNEFEISKLDNMNNLLAKDNQIQNAVLESQIRKNQYLYLFATLTLVICILLVFILHRARQSKRKFEQLSMFDELTKLANRRNVFQLLLRQIDLSIRHQEDLVVAIIDLDLFKQINDKFGHIVGDKVLVEFAKLCKITLRKTDIIGRIGGEEFLVALPKTNKQQAIAILEKLKEATLTLPRKSKQLAVLNQQNNTISISIGITQLTQSDGQEEIFSRADKALYKAKANGRNQIQAA